MLSLKQRAIRAQTLLSPCAVPILGTLGREHAEEEDGTRFPFQRDRDRILHTQAFRRLKHKTQVFVSGHGDHYRTRITHTLEVSQIARDIARTLALNEDLTECIALAHDLGHTPFGHAGEEAMDACLKPYKKRFEHNEQSLRVVTLLEKRCSAYVGLNLSREVLEGLVKHRTPHDRPNSTPPHAPSLEAAVVNLADEIAYTAHDTDDGLRAGLFSASDVARTALGRAATAHAKRRGTEIRGAIVHLLVTDLIATTEALLQKKRIRTLAQVYGSTVPLVMFSPSMTRMLREHRRFLWTRLYRSPAIKKQAERGKVIITKLFRSYMRRPPSKIRASRMIESDRADAVKDYIAGMTDGYAMETAKKV